MGTAPNADYAGTIPQPTFMVYQLMFAIITPALISGAFAERMKFSAMLLFTVLWTLVVYFPDGAHGVGQGRTVERLLGRQDSHASISPAARWCISPAAFRRWSARSIWASASVTRSRPMKPHNLVISIIGAGCLWVGWFGFNAGSALAASRTGDQRVRGDPFRRGRGDLGLDGRGMDGRRQAQRAGRDFGLRGRPGGHHSGLRLRQAVPGDADRRLRGRGLLLHGDAREAASSATTTRWTPSACTASAGRWARILTGVFATSFINDGLKDAAGKVQPLGLVDGNGGQVLNQLIGVAIAWVLAIVGTLVILKIVRRGDRRARDQGAGNAKAWILSMHNEEGYIFEA